MPRERAGFLPLMRTVHTANSTGVVDFPTEPAKRNNLSARFCFANQKPWNCRDAVHPNSKICAIFDTFKHNCASFNPYVGVRFSLMTLFFLPLFSILSVPFSLSHIADGWMDTPWKALHFHIARESPDYTTGTAQLFWIYQRHLQPYVCVCVFVSVAQPLQKPLKGSWAATNE